MKLTSGLTLLSFSAVHSFTPNFSRRGSVIVRVSDLYGPPQRTRPVDDNSAASSPTSPRPRTMEDDLPQLAMENELSSFVDSESGAKSEQKNRLSAVQDRLLKTMELKDRVENLLINEIEGIVEKLEAESNVEGIRAEDIRTLASKFEGVLGQKREAVERDEELLAALLSTKGMVREASIQATMQSAIDDKATLCSIERELIDKMEQCLVQLDEEFKESTSRQAKMDQVRAALPSVENRVEVRSYSWTDIGALNEVLVENAASALKREAAVESIKADFAYAMDRRRRILSGQPLLPPPSPPAPAPMKSAGSAAMPPPPLDATVVAQPASSLGGGVSAGRVVRPSANAKAPLTNDELAAELSSAASELGGSVAKATGALVGGVVGFVTSSDAQATAAATGKAVGGYAAAAKAARKAWDNAMQKTIAANVKKEQTGEDGVWWVKGALDTVLSSSEVQESLDSAKAEAKAAVDSLGKAGNALINPPKEESGALTSTASPVGAVSKATVRLAKIVSALVGRIAGNDDGSFTLPPGR